MQDSICMQGEWLPRQPQEACQGVGLASKFLPAARLGCCLCITSKTLKETLNFLLPYCGVINNH